MTIYMILIMSGLLLIGTSIVSNQRDLTNPLKSSKNSISISLCVSVLFVAIITIVYIIRGYTVGSDYQMYHGYYLLGSSAAILNSASIEKGYLLIYQISHSFGSFTMFNIITFSIIILFGYFMIRKLNIDPLAFWGFFLVSFTYFVTFNMVRQFTAICIVYMGLFIRYNSNEDAFSDKVKSWGLFALSIFIAHFFHNSAVLAIMLPLSFLIPVSTISVLVSTVATVIVYFSGIVNQIVPVLTRFFPHYLEKYAGEDFFFSTSTKGITELLPILIQFILLLSIVSLFPKFVHNHKYLCSLYLVYLILFAGAGNFTILRVQSYWLPSIVLFYSKFYASEDTTTSRYISAPLFKMITIVFWTSYCIYRIMTNTSGVYPYLVSFN